MQVFNGTHIRWQQVQTDNRRPPKEMGQVIDDVWFVQETHGPRADPNTSALDRSHNHKPQRSQDHERVGHRLEGLEAFEPASVINAGEAQCLYVRDELRCEDSSFEKDGRQFGVWQATAGLAELAHELQV